MAGRNKARSEKKRFDDETGCVNIVEGSDVVIDFAIECENCGTLIEYLTERCPICGRKFDVANTGIASLFSDMEFDDEDSSEIDCPVCGEKVKPFRGKCPACKETIGFVKNDDSGSKVDPIVHDDNVVFVHLDVEAGEVNCLQRVGTSPGVEHLSVRLETIGQGRFDHERKGVCRM